MADPKLTEKIDVAWIDPGYTSGHFAHSIAREVGTLQYFEGFGEVNRVATSIPARGRNLLVQEFLENSESEWLWMVDSDMVFDRGHALKLWSTASELDVKIVSGLAFVFRNNEQPVPSYFLVSDGKLHPKGQLYMPYNKIPEEPMTVAATGLASTLCHRSVFEAMPTLRDENFRWFDHIEWEGNSHLLGEDVSFFMRAGELGFPTVLEPRAETWHVKNIGVGRPDYDRYWWLREQKFAIGEL